MLWLRYCVRLLNFFCRNNHGCVAAGKKVMVHVPVDSSTVYWNAETSDGVGAVGSGLGAAASSSPAAVQEGAVGDFGQVSGGIRCAVKSSC